MGQFSAAVRKDCCLKKQHSDKVSAEVACLVSIKHADGEEIKSKN